MSQFARYAADLIVVLHFGFVAFVVVGQAAILLGGLLGRPFVRNRAFRLTHLACILVVVAESWFGVECPLTTWENQLRSIAGETGYRGDFIASWVHDQLYFDWPTWVFTTIYSLFGATVIAAWWWIPPQKTASARSESGAV